MCKYLTLLLILIGSTNCRCAAIRIHGTDDTETKQLMNKISPMLQFILNRPATSWRANDAAFQLEQAVLKRGYPDAKVTSKIQQNTIHLYIQKGIQRYFGEITTRDRTTLTPELISDYFYQPLIQAQSVSKSNAPYISKFTKLGATNVENYLKSIGYWKAHVTALENNQNSDNQRVDIKISIYQGRLHTLSEPTFLGSTNATKSNLKSLTSGLHDKIASSQNIQEIIQIVNAYFDTEGYQFAEVESEITHRLNKTNITFRINQGLKFKTRSLKIIGHKNTKPRKIKRFYSDIEGQTYNATQIDKNTNSLLQTGIFKRASITTQQVLENEADLLLDVEEGKTVTTSAYIGTDSYEGPIVGLSYTDLNFLGNMWNLSCRGEWTGRGLLGEVGVTEPFFAGEKISFNLRTFALRRSPDGYNKLEVGSEASWTWSPNDKYNTRLYIGSAAVTTSSTNMTAAELGTADYLNTKLGWTNNLDLRDDPVLPYQGYNGKLLTEIGTNNGDTQVTYLKLELNNSYRYSLGPQHHLISRFDLGVITPKGSNKFPIDRRFFTGGSNSVRAVKERTLGPRSVAGDPLGGESYWVGSTEYVRQIKGPFYSSVFYDLGQVYSKADQLDFSNPTQSIGLGARIHLPIGPIRFEYGHNLNRKKRQPSGAFHFSIGASF